MTRHDVFGGSLIAIFLGLIGSMSGLAYYLANSDPLDPATLCPKSHPLGHTIVLVDRTDPLTEEHKALLKGAMDRASATLIPDERLSVFLIEAEAPVVPIPVFSRCKPRDGADASWLYENERLIRARYENEFLEPLSAKIRGLEKPAEAPQSPIMETVRNIAALPEFTDATERRRLIVVSDLLQNIPAYSQYRRAADFDAFIASPYGRSVVADLAGVEVEVVYLRRQKDVHHQGERHLVFWRQYFAESGAFIARMVQ